MSDDPVLFENIDEGLAPPPHNNYTVQSSYSQQGVTRSPTPMDTERRPNGKAVQLADPTSSAYQPLPEGEGEAAPPPPPGLRDILKGKNFVLQLALIAVMTAEGLFRKATSTLYMRNYRTLLNMIIVLFAGIVFFSVEYYQKHISHTITTDLSKRHLLWYGVIAIFDTLATYMIILSNTYVSAPVATLLQQGVIPLSIIATILIMKKKYHWIHYLGAAILLGGIGVSVSGSYDHHHHSHKHGGDDEGDRTKFGWAVVFFLANLPIALGSILKEIIMTSPEDPAPMMSLNAWVAAFQFLLSFALSPAGYMLQDPDQHVKASHLFDNFHDGMKCWLEGHNSIVSKYVCDPPSTDCIDHCSGAVWAVWVHILLVVLLNIVALLVIFHGSAVMFFVAGAVTIPLTAAVSAAPFMGSLRVEFNWEDILAIVLTFIGMVTYHLKPEGGG